MSASHRQVFITGATGYMGRRLISRLLAAGHQVRALARPGSESKLPLGCQVVLGNALDASTYESQVAPAETFVHLVGVAHPSPAKAAQFRSVDLPSGLAAVQAAVKARIQHFVYVSVAQPAPIMKAYIEVRAQCEARIHQSGVNATILRPWYVLGPGHRWPYLLLPVYGLLERLPKTRESARRLGLVTIQQMIDALVDAVENPARGFRIVEVPQIRASRSYAPKAAIGAA
jgi:uncharacterized protein YbjT (DUF2867 family)